MDSSSCVMHFKNNRLQQIIEPSQICPRKSLDSSYLYRWLHGSELPQQICPMQQFQLLLASVHPRKDQRSAIKSISLIISLTHCRRYGKLAIPSSMKGTLVLFSPNSKYYTITKQNIENKNLLVNALIYSKARQDHRPPYNEYFDRIPILALLSKSCQDIRLLLGFHVI